VGATVEVRSAGRRRGRDVGAGPALALLHIADKAGARVAFIGDRRQLAAVGRGGAVDMALAWDPTFVQMDSVYRFRFPDGTLDQAYADLSLRLRGGVDPAAVFDALQTSGRVVVHGSERDMTVASPRPPLTGTPRGSGSRCRPRRTTPRRR